jgi:hypothetical protein
MFAARHPLQKTVTCVLLCAMFGMGLKLAAPDGVRPAGMRQVLELLSNKKSLQPVPCCAAG